MARRALLFLVLALVARPAAAFDFGLLKQGATTIGVGCYDIKTADLNGDGRADAVAAVYDAHAVTVVLGASTGLGTKTIYVAGHTVAVDLADFDGNGTIDVLEADWNENQVRLWLNSGTGTLVSSAFYPVTGNPRDVASGDFDGNGTRDIVVATGNGKIAYLSGLPGGGFAPAAYSTLSTALKGIAVGDLDLDGDLDLVVVDPLQNKLSRFRNDGLAPFPFTLVSQVPFTVTGHPSDVALSDLDGDGVLDAAVSIENGFVATLRGGTTDFELPMRTFPIGTLAQSVQVADFDQEGGPDLLVSSYTPSTVSVLRNQGGMTFGATVSAACGKSPRGAAAGDVNGDGRMDVVSGDFEAGTATLLLNAAAFGRLAYLPDSLAFGADFQGYPANLPIQFQNVGMGTLTVTPGAIDGGQFTYAGSSAPLALSAGATGTISIRYPRAAVGDATGAVHFATSDTLAAQVTIGLSGSAFAAFPKLVSSPAVLDFGEDYAGYAAVLPIQLENTGHAVLTVTPEPIDGDQFVYVASNPIQVQIGGSATLSVRYLRTQLGPAAGTVHLATNDPDLPAVSIGLLGSATPAFPKIAYAPATLDFGTDFVGHDAVLPIQVTNVGHAVLTVTPGTIDGDAFSYQGTTDPIHVPIGGNASVSIRYVRALAGVASGTVHLSTDDPDAPEVTIALVGFAGIPPKAGFSAPARPVVAVGTQAQRTLVVRNLGGSPLHVTVPADAGDLVEESALDLGPSGQEFVRIDPSEAGWNIDTEGRVISGTTGEYAGGMDEQNFLAQTSGVLGLGGRELRLGPVAVAPGIMITRKIFIPEAGGWARFIDVAENPNGDSRVATFDLVDNIGYVSAGLIKTSDGNATYDLTDDWVVVPATGGHRSVGRVYRSVGSANVPVTATWFSTTGAPGSFTRTKYVALLAPHARLCVIQWAVQGVDPEAAIATLEALRLDPSSGLVHADVIDRGSAWNLIQAPHAFRPVAGSHVIAPGDSVEIPIVFGAESATHDADLSGTLRLATDDPDHRVLAVPLAFSIGGGLVIGVPGESAGAALALTGFRPNPTRMSGSSRVAFRLASSEPATLTLYDVRGRVLARQALAAPQPGPGSIALGGASLKPGVVWMRLEQGGKVATGKGIVLP